MAPPAHTCMSCLACRIGCESPELRDVIKWLRALPEATLDEWGLNATDEIAGWLDSGRWRSMLDKSEDRETK